MLNVTQSLPQFFSAKLEYLSNQTDILIQKISEIVKKLIFRCDQMGSRTYKITLLLGLSAIAVFVIYRVYQVYLKKMFSRQYNFAIADRCMLENEKRTREQALPTLRKKLETETDPRNKESLLFGIKQTEDCLKNYPKKMRQIEWRIKFYSFIT